MASKIGDVAYVVVILIFLISAFTFFLNEADLVTDVNSGVTSSLGLLNKSLKGASSVETTLSYKIDESGEFVVEEEQQVDTRAAESGGIINLFSKNVLVRFIAAVAQETPIPTSVFVLLLSLITIGITILAVRFFMGEAKV